jgi:hypothetical protein
VSDIEPTSLPTISRGRAGNEERAMARAAETVAGVAPGVDAVLARAAIAGVTSRSRSRNMITD